MFLSARRIGGVHRASLALRPYAPIHCDYPRPSGSSRSYDRPSRGMPLAPQYVMAAATELRTAAQKERAMKALRRKAARWRGCPLAKGATQIVFGAGPATAQLMLIGEAPATQEDKAGVPFVGPAGRVLDAALEKAGLERDELYVTNVEKFKHRRVGG